MKYMLQQGHIYIEKIQMNINDNKEYIPTADQRNS